MSTIGIDQIEIDEFPLVVALRTIGVPWADENCRMLNIYTEDFLRKINKTAEEAKKAGIPGNKQVWIFKRTDELEAARKIFRDLWDNNEKIVDFPNIDTATMLKIGILFLKNRGPIAADFRNHTPRVAISRGTEGEVTLLTSKTTAAARAQMGIE